MSDSADRSRTIRGACCSYSSNWPRFTTEDDAALALGFPSIWPMPDNPACAAMADRCFAHWPAEVGVATSCTIYAVRPEVCRTCMPGDVECGRWHGKTGRACRRLGNRADGGGIATRLEPDYPSRHQQMALAREGHAETKERMRCRRAGESFVLEFRPRRLPTIHRRGLSSIGLIALSGLVDKVIGLRAGPPDVAGSYRRRFLRDSA